MTLNLDGLLDPDIATEFNAHTDVPTRVFLMTAQVLRNSTPKPPTVPPLVVSAMPATAAPTKAPV